MKNLAKKFVFEFSERKKLARNTYTFYFKRSEDFDFIPGQYFKMYLDITEPDVRGSSRYFTISSSRNDKDTFQITTKIVSSAFKKKLHSLKKGDKVNFFGPIGYFDFNLNSKKPKIFLAGGIGITPYRSILTSMDHKVFKGNIVLIATFTEFKDVVFYEELKEIEKNNPRIKVIYSLSNETRSGFEAGRMTTELIEKYAPNFRNSEIFIVGSPAMEEEIFNLVCEMGVPEKNIFKENFTGY